MIGTQNTELVRQKFQVFGRGIARGAAGVRQVEAGAEGTRMGPTEYSIFVGEQLLEIPHGGMRIAGFTTPARQFISVRSQGDCDGPYVQAAPTGVRVSPRSR